MVRKGEHVVKATIGPGQYVRKAGALSEVGYFMKPLGTKAILISGKKSGEIVEEVLKESLAEQGISLLQSLWYGGESSESNITNLIERLNDYQYDVLIVAGGGKAIDTVKSVAYLVNKPLVAIPTIAATCAAATPIWIKYSDEGEFLEIARDAKAPELVIVDSSVILHAPVRYLIAGIGDTLAKWFETKCSIKKATPTVLNQTAISIAAQLYETLLQMGKRAVTSVEERTLSKDLENVIDAIILVSGSVSGYGGDDCRTAAAHAIYSGLTIFPEVHETYHGEIVAFGILAQLCMEGVDVEEIQTLIQYYQEVGLPFSLKQMGIVDLSEAQWKQLGEITITIEDMANMPFLVTAEMVIAAVKQADQLGNDMLNKSMVGGYYS
jgi:glycerol dehydrogenase